MRHKKLRPDLHLTGATAEYIVDVTVVHPTSPGRVRAGYLPRDASDKTLHAVEKAAYGKTWKYRPMMDELRSRPATEHVQFIPFACDVYGGLGEDARRLIDWLVKEGEMHDRFRDGTARRQFRAKAYARLSVAIQSAAAICAVDSARRIRCGVSARAV